MGIKQSKWQTHLAAAQESGLSLAGDADRHGINVRRLYETRHARARAKAAKARKASGFVRIKLKPELPAIVSNVHQPRAVTALTMHVRLGNGVVLGWKPRPNERNGPVGDIHLS